MKHSTRSRLALLALLAPLAGCSNDVERLVELEEKKAAAYEEAGDDCEAIAAALMDFKKEHGKEHSELMDKLKAKYDGDEEAAKKAAEPYEERMKKSKKIIVGAVFKCSDNEAYGKAMDFKP